MTEPQTIDIDDYFKDCASSITLDMLTKNPVTGSITPHECSKYKIRACVVSYMNMHDCMCINPISWANTSYYISDTMYSDDDHEKNMPFRVFVGIKD
jgi:hypothetical protein